MTNKILFIKIIDSFVKTREQGCTQNVDVYLI